MLISGCKGLINYSHGIDLYVLHSTAVALLIREIGDLSFFVDNSIQHSYDEDSCSEDEETIDEV